MELTVIDHPLAARLLTRLRDKTTDRAAFRLAMDELAGMLVYEACRTLPTQPVEVVTLRAVALGTPALQQLPDTWDLEQPAGPDTAPAVFDGQRLEVPVVRRCMLAVGDSLHFEIEAQRIGGATDSVAIELRDGARLEGVMP